MRISDGSSDVCSSDLPLRSRSDALAERWRALAAFRNGRVPHDARRSALAAIDAAAKQWRRRLRVDAAPPRDVEAHRLGGPLAHALSYRLAHRQLGRASAAEKVFPFG